MSFKDWVDNTVEQIDALGPYRGGRAGLYELWEGMFRVSGRLWNYGTPIYEEEWDVILLLDACRVDALQEVADEYEFLPETIPSHNSPASNSSEWVRKTFADQYSPEMQNTAYITANPHSEMISERDLQILDEVWEYAWPEVGSVRPESVNDRIIDINRNHDPDRIIAHYMQPHLPFRAEMYPEESEVDIEHDLGHSEDGLRNVYKRMRDNEVPKEVVWEAYLDNLRWVLDNVETLLNNIDAEKVVISSDHSELFGDWGCYCHPGDALIPELKRVPWVETSATDTGEYEPTVEPDKEFSSAESNDLEEKLEDLGYL